MRHIVTVVTQRRGVGVWVTEGVEHYGPFYTPATAREFARRVAVGAQRTKWSMSMMHEPTFEDGSWVLDNFSSRVVITAVAIRPSSVRSAWHTIRTFFKDRRVA